MMILKILFERGIPEALYSLAEIKELLEANGLPEALQRLEFNFKLSLDHKAKLMGAITNLWTNGYIRKFATGRFTVSAGGRVVGVLWEIRGKS